MTTDDILSPMDEDRSLADLRGALAGKTVLVTGAAGNLGTHICQTCVREDAYVIMTGRTRERIDAARDALIKETGAPPDRVAAIVLDGGDPDSVRAALEGIRSDFGRIDVLINNAGSAGPKQPLAQVPFTNEEMEALGESETVSDAMRNILGVTWNLCRVAVPMMPKGGSVVNISTIFSHTRYFGRTAYTVPKAVLNALSRSLAEELGERGIRVNNIFPGPIESDRIRTVFAAMDKAQGQPEGATADYFTNRMSLTRPVQGSVTEKTLPRPEDIAEACLFLASDKSAALNGCEIDVTHGMRVRKDYRSAYMRRPTTRSLDGAGSNILVVGGEDWSDGIEVARILLDLGANVLLGLARQADVAQAQARTQAQGMTDGLEIVRFNRSEPEKLETALSDYTKANGPITGAILSPIKAPETFRGPLINASDEMVETFMNVEMTGMISLGRTLERYWQGRTDLPHAPRVVFMSNTSDGAGNIYNAMLSAGVTQLIRTWRNEAETVSNRKGHPHAVWANQIIRYTNEEDENLRFAAGHATRIVFKENKLAEIDLDIPSSIAEQTGAHKAMVGFAENITGLHLGKVAFITGGSAGIGGQIARLLAVAGAKVMMVARREAELQEARAQIVRDLQDLGFAGVERRVKVIAGVDVSNFESLKAAADATVEEFGRIDYLINNAGVAGAEDMVVDMDIDAWRFTLDANLISNYLLIDHVVPAMKARGSGYVLNVSSYFGGEKFLAVAYPNRADYAVSKAGQRAMVESFSEYLGPEIQCNAIAPGPVDGDRLSGTGNRPGLFMRRAKLILENKRLNSTYAAVIKSIREGAAVDKVLDRLMRNSISVVSHDGEAPEILRRLAVDCARQGDGICTWDQFILTPTLAVRLLSRLRLGGYLAEFPEWVAASQSEASAEERLVMTPPDDKPFLPENQVLEEAEKIGRGVLSKLHLGTMPTEADVAQATVFFLADRAVSGETFMPSGGLRVERSTTEREMFGSPKEERIEQMRGKTVWLIGEHLADYIAETVKSLVNECDVGKVIVLARTSGGIQKIRDLVAGADNGRMETMIAGDDIESAMDQALAEHGRPVTVVSMPNEGLPDTLFDEGARLSAKGFSAVVEENLTQHFRVGRKASLYDGCQLVIVSPDVPYGTRTPAFALANFIKTTLHAFTATLGVENERLVHDVPVNQINLTRRVRSEEPRDEDEHNEELKRFVRAVLLVGSPLPDAQDSRYRSRIYRGTSMTV